MKLPNLKHLKVHLLTAEMMELIATSMTKLEMLVYSQIPANAPSPLNRYEEMKTDELLIINHAIQLEHRAYP